jgi:uncharacterized protein with ACT and thioredoxin-like domain
MQLNSPTTGLYSCVVLLLAQNSNLVEEDSLVVVRIPVVGEGNLEEDSLAVAHTPAVDTLEEAFAALLCRIVVAHVDQD